MIFITRIIMIIIICNFIMILQLYELSSLAVAVVFPIVSYNCNYYLLLLLLLLLLYHLSLSTNSSSIHSFIYYLLIYKFIYTPTKVDNIYLSIFLSITQLSVHYSIYQSLHPYTIHLSILPFIYLWFKSVLQGWDIIGDPSGLIPIFQQWKVLLRERSSS